MENINITADITFVPPNSPVEMKPKFILRQMMTSNKTKKSPTPMKRIVKPRQLVCDAPIKKRGRPKKPVATIPESIPVISTPIEPIKNIDIEYLAFTLLELFTICDPLNTNNTFNSFLIELYGLDITFFSIEKITSSQTVSVRSINHEDGRNKYIYTDIPLTIEDMTKLIENLLQRIAESKERKKSREIYRKKCVDASIYADNAFKQYFEAFDVLK